MSNKVAYFARPVTQFGNKQDRRDIELIESLGYQVIEITDHESQENYNTYGMQYFMDVIDQFADVLFFRSWPDMGIGAGIGKEIQRAESKGIPVLELPTLLHRVMDVEDTRETLKLMGFR